MLPQKTKLLSVVLLLFLITFQYPSWSQRLKKPSLPIHPLSSLGKEPPNTIRKRKIIPGRYIIIYKEQSAPVARQVAVTDPKERNRLMRQEIATTLQKHQLTQKPVLHIYGTLVKGFTVDGLSDQEVAQLKKDDQIISVEPDYSFSVDFPKTQAIINDGETCVPASVIADGARNNNIGTANFGSSNSVTANGIVLTDLGCAAISNPAIKDKIAIIDRGDCSFSIKAYNAQLAEAVGVIIVNNMAGNSITNMSGNEDMSLVTIPALMISKEKGDELKAAIASKEVSITMNPNALNVEECKPWGITRVNGGVNGAGAGKKAWVIDTGIDLDHPDLNVNQTLSKNFATDQSNADDPLGHGTHVAGTIAAKHNGFGVVGVVPGIEVVAIRIFNAAGETSEAILYAAYDYVASAITNPEDVINMSFGSNSLLPNIHKNILLNLANKGRLVIAAGNDAMNTSFFELASIKASNIYIVSSITRNNDTFSSFSNYGNSITYAAPGSEIISCLPGGGYGSKSGTSMAAPHVTGMLLAGNMYISGLARNDPDKRADPIPALSCVENNIDADNDDYTVCEGDWDDNDKDVYPGAPELCDNKDNDGDGLVDEGDVCCPALNGSILYVKKNATAGGDGYSWNTAYRELSDALNLAKKCTKVTQIWVASGTYYPTTDELGVATPLNARFKTFSIRENLAVYGNLAGNEPADYNMDLRDFNTNETVLSGDFQQDDNPYNNAFNVVQICPDYNQTITNTVLLDGLSIIEGVANSTFYPHYTGGGIVSVGTASTVRNCYVFNNSAILGGGFATLSGKSSIRNSYFAANFSSQYGSAFYGNEDNASILNSIFVLNRSSTEIGGSIMNWYGSLDVRTTTVTANSSTTHAYPGGIVTVSGSTAINNSIIWRNKTNVSGYNGASTTISYSISESFPTAGENSSQNPMFVIPPDYDKKDLGNISLLPCSPAINKGNPAYTITEVGKEDIWGMPRIYKDRVDIGAAEYQSDPMLVSITASPGLTINQEGSTITLSASGADKYLWSTAETTATIVVTPTTSQTYTVTGYIGDADQCQMQASASIDFKLPVQLLSFTAQATAQKSVRIDWQTTDELNNDYFEIERSTDLATITSIAKVKATESNSTLHQYSLVDETPVKGRNYYRLVQVDEDGTKTRYDWTSVVLDQQYHVYPNPVTAGTFSVQLDEGFHSKVSLTNNEGNSIPFTMNRTNGQVQIQLPKEISPGVYHLKVQERGQATLHKVIVQ